MDELRDYVESQTREWGTYVAREPINFGGARAFNEGDPVPVSHVTRGVVRMDQVLMAIPADAVIHEMKIVPLTEDDMKRI